MRAGLNRVNLVPTVLSGDCNGLCKDHRDPEKANDCVEEGYILRENGRSCKSCWCCQSPQLKHWIFLPMFVHFFLPARVVLELTVAVSAIRRTTIRESTVGRTMVCITPVWAASLWVSAFVSAIVVLIGRRPVIWPWKQIVRRFARRPVVTLFIPQVLLVVPRSPIIFVLTTCIAPHVAIVAVALAKVPICSYTVLAIGVVWTACIGRD